MNAQIQALKAANDYRRIRKACLPLMVIAQGKPAAVQASIHVAIVEVIGSVVNP